MSKRRNLKQIWEEQRQKECEQVRPLAEKIANAIIKNAESTKKLTTTVLLTEKATGFIIGLA